VFRLVGGHVFGATYTGGIGTILTAWFDALKASKDIQGLCIQCGNCTQVCPTRIDIPEMIVELRHRIAREDGQTLFQKGAFAVVSNRRVFHAVLRAASLAQKPFAKGGFVRHLPFFLSGISEHRSLPAIADEPFRERVKRLPPPARATEKAVLFAGCLIDFAYPGVGEAVVKVLGKAGIEVVFPEGQTCCGAPARYSGAFDVAAENARDNVRALEDAGATYVVSACPTCTVALKHEMAASLRAEGDEAFAARADALAAKVQDFATLVRRLAAEGRLTLRPAADGEAVTYHDSCHLKRRLGVHEASRDLLRQAGHPVKEMFESDMCCGMGGSYSLKFPEISKPILERKLENVRRTGARTAVTDCPGCVMQIGGGLHKAGDAIGAKHLAELLAARVE
jgi:Fe-S oxidoreductase